MPDNVVLSLRPMKVKIIDFDRSFSMAVGTKETMVGTDGYYPFKPNMDDGSPRWDVWSLGAMILEADMEKDHYLNVDSERVAQSLCKKLVRDL